MVTIEWSEPALNQLEQILDYIALDKPDVATHLANHIFKSVDYLVERPKLGKAVPEIKHKAYRQLWIKPCWIYYRLETSVIFILHVRRTEQSLNLINLFHG